MRRHGARGIRRARQLGSPGCDRDWIFGEGARHAGLDQSRRARRQDQDRLRQHAADPARRPARRHRPVRVLARLPPGAIRQRRGRGGRRRRHRRTHVHAAAGGPAKSQGDVGDRKVTGGHPASEAEIEQDRIQREMIEFDATRRGPLDGVRVLDLSRLVAGNMVSLQLADLGAEVIKVEPPQGDPPPAWLDDGKPLFWKTYARNKRSIVLNLRMAAGKEALLRLVERADVLIENYRPGTLEQMALGPDVLHVRNADLILVRISGFGQTGPYAQLPGFGTLVEALRGLARRP